MKAFYINFTNKTFVAGVTYRDDSLQCVLSILDVVMYVANRTGEDGKIWQVELDDKTFKFGDIYSHAKEVKFLKLYDLNKIKQAMGEYLIDYLLDDLSRNDIYLDHITIKDPAADALLYMDQVIDTVSNLSRIMTSASDSINAMSVSKSLHRPDWNCELHRLIELSAPDKSIAA